MHLTRIAIHRPVTTLMASLGLMFLGLISYRELAVQRLPDITFPAMMYSASMVNADLSPEETNDELTRPFEKLVGALPGLKETRSWTSAGSFQGLATFQRGTDMRFRVIELQEAAGKWLAGREDQVRVNIVPQSTDEQSGALMELVLSVPTAAEARVEEVSDLVRRRLRSIDGIARVQIDGELFPNLVLEADRDDLLAVGLDVQPLLEKIDARGGDPRWLGILPEGTREHAVYFDDRAKSVADLMATRVDAEGVFTLADVTRVEPRIEEGESIFRINGMKAVRVSITRERDRNTIRMARQVRARLEEIRAALPAGFELTVTHDEALDLEKLVSNLSRLALGGAVLAMLVLLVFVRSWRIALIVVAAIPASILVTFNAMYAAGLSINILSLLGLAAGVGMLVDNSIVVVENVFRHARLGRERLEAAWLGSREVARAIIVSTTTNLIVFLPMLFMDDMLVIVMREMALSLVLPMIVSLLVAMTLVPMLTARVVGGRPVHAGAARRRRVAWPVRWNPWHRPGRKPRNIGMEFIFYCVKGSLRHPARLLAAIVSVLMLTLASAAIKVAVQPRDMNDQTRTLTLYGKPPVGSDLEAADKFFAAQEALVRAEIRGSPVFETFTSRFDMEGGQIDLRISEPYRRIESSEFRQAYQKAFVRGDDRTGFRFRPFPTAAAGMAQAAAPTRESGSEQVRITGENMDAMLRSAEQVRALLEKTADVGGVYFDTPMGAPEVVFQPDLELFRVMQADAGGLRSFFQARDPRGLATDLVLHEEGIDRPVKLKVRDRELEREQETDVRQTLGELRRSRVALAGGGSLPLERLGRFGVRHAEPFITKQDRQRHVQVTFNFKPAFYKPGMEKTRQESLKAIQASLAGVRLPEGVSASMAGTLDEVETQRASWRRLLFWGILAIYLVMAFFFESLLSPLVILLTLPLATIGAIWGLILFQARLDEVAMLGTVILAGLVVNNGILLIEYIQQMQRERGWRRPRALLGAVAYRFRPILMTSLTTILGLLPILLSDQAAREARSLVSVLVGGMIASGLLTLVVIPTYYNVMMNGLDRLRALRGRFRRGAKAAPAPEPIADGPLLIRLDNVRKIYPTFHRGKLLHWIPPRSYSYGRRPAHGNAALKGVSLTIEPGMFGLLGPNGAGKTTLIKIMAGLVGQTYGVAEVCGHDLRRDRGAVRSQISYLPQDFGVYQMLTLEQYLDYFALFYGLDDRSERRRRIGEAIEWVGLTEVRDKPMKRFSGGMRQRAGIAQLLLRPARIMIVDEPTAGLDPVERVRFRLLLAELARTRIVILSTHIVDDITSSCRKVAVLHRGQVVYHGETDRIQATARGKIWDLALPAEFPSPIPERHTLFRRHLGDRILYHYYAPEPLEGAIPVEPTFEDAYVALLMGHENGSIKAAPAEAKQPVLVPV